MILAKRFCGGDFAVKSALLSAALFQTKAVNIDRITTFLRVTVCQA
jgi:hypothetical protein